MTLAELFTLSPHGGDVYVGQGHVYPWGGLYGGHIVAQALRASSLTVDDGFVPHSLRAYFIRRGDFNEPVRYEVDRIRNGRSFCTRRVVARQAIGAILNLEASFQVEEKSAEAAPVVMASNLPRPDDLADDSWSPYFDRRMVPYETMAAANRDGRGTSAGWFRLKQSFHNDELMNRCALAYISDDLPTDAVVQAVPELKAVSGQDMLFSASLDHTVWFHRPVQADEWHLYEMSCYTYIGGRGISFGYVFAEDGTHVATVAQEVLVRLKESN